jgi:D-alanyl-D-alanine carboxypeptidase/D-alanyl-D-alanine-endopeptidase (penicillin-binding protein 4)
VLKGNLVLQGGGDPAISLERLWLLLRDLRSRGLREIQGDVLLDQRYYALEQRDATPFDQTPLRPYNAPPAALLVNFNTVQLHLGATPRLDPEEGVPLLDIPMAVDAPCNGYKDRLALVDGRLTLARGYAPACGEAVLALNLMPPEATAAAWFRQLWRESGGMLKGVVRAGQAAQSAQLFLEFDSLPVADLVRDTNKFSNNVTAKMLFLNLGAARFGAPATWEKGEQAVREWLAEKDLECGQLVLENGSGLSRHERASPRFFARLLRWAARQPLWFEFAASLPAAGLEGTWKSRLPASSARGQAWLKSGSLKDARNLAGYVRTRDGRRRVLVLFINHDALDGAGRVQDALVEWAAEGAEALPESIGKIGRAHV